MKRIFVNLLDMLLVVLFIGIILVSCDTMFGSNDNNTSSDSQSALESTVRQAFDDFAYEPTEEEIQAVPQPSQKHNEIAFPLHI
jgi:hypothetical protein